MENRNQNPNQVSPNINNYLNQNLNHKNQFPDFSEQGYQIESILGQNYCGGRVTYQAINIQNQEKVVIKQFQFATIGATWSGFTAFQREIELLKKISHPRIPKYINSFETNSGFCLVQEYKNAQNLAQKCFLLLDLNLANISKIATSSLEILIYLQQQETSIIHRDIKPENILIDGELNTYLVDFGLARISDEEMSASTTVKGTLGFMPPEQIFGKPLTNASDLYSLGATLICLLTQTPSPQIGDLIDDSFRFKIQQLLPELNLHWVDWLEKMVAPSQAERFPNAVTALNALNRINYHIANGIIPSTQDKCQRQLPKVVVTSLGIMTVLAFASHLQTPQPYPTPLLIENNMRSLPKPDFKRRLKRSRECVGCFLRYTVLREEDLRSLNLERIDLTGADLTGADLRGTYLGGANLNGAKLEGTNLESTDLRGAIMPDGSIHP
ncbi:serine/threonine-protein kinase [Calothrix sp. UHCC 0171]|uniref:serine/threonine-protein kinase n=1 Tax=Calothrix sp. UHCC 0171 TaxID=3110245 RepID=UPI002B2122B2|nr:serine/threonine-protein kinase [Calothrix sp. UHCC 0171]MEA5574199.1 serine/threonine-protein kinase [Calothrix sp. UHCC 0171]